MVPCGEGATLGCGAAESSPGHLPRSRPQGAGLPSALVLQSQPRELVAGGSVVSFLSCGQISRGPVVSGDNSASSITPSLTLAVLLPVSPLASHSVSRKPSVERCLMGVQPKMSTMPVGCSSLEFRGIRSSWKCTFGSRPHRHGNPTHGWRGSTKGGQCGLKTGERVAMGHPLISSRRGRRVLGLSRPLSVWALGERGRHCGF